MKRAEAMCMTVKRSNYLEVVEDRTHVCGKDMLRKRTEKVN